MLRVHLVKPPEQTRMDFGTFSLEVLASAISDIASVDILNATSLSIEEAATEIFKKNPDVTGITVMGIKSVNPVCAFVGAIRQTGFKGQIVVGGHGASMLPQTILQSGADVVVYGEGELTFREILQLGISEKVQGIYLLQEGHLLKTTQRAFIDVDKLKEPARNLSNTPESNIYLLETSRGCPHSCSFCETSRFFSRTWRGRSPSNVVEDIRKLVHGGAMIIQIADDNFTSNPKRALEICDLLKNEPLPLFFLFSGRSDDLTNNPELIPTLAKANFLRGLHRRRNCRTRNSQIDREKHKLQTTHPSLRINEEGRHLHYCFIYRRSPRRKRKHAKKLRGLCSQTCRLRRVFALPTFSGNTYGKRCWGT